MDARSRNRIKAKLWFRGSTADVDVAGLTNTQMRAVYWALSNPEKLTDLKDFRDLDGRIVIDGRRWTAPICHSEGADPYVVFLWSIEGHGCTPEDALKDLREQMLSVAVDDRDDQGEAAPEGAPEIEVVENSA